MEFISWSPQAFLTIQVFYLVSTPTIATACPPEPYYFESFIFYRFFIDFPWLWKLEKSVHPFFDKQNCNITTRPINTASHAFFKSTFPHLILFGGHY